MMAVGLSLVAIYVVTANLFGGLPNRTIRCWRTWVAVGGILGIVLCASSVVIWAWRVMP